VSPVPAPKYGYETGVRDEILGGLKSDLFPLLSFLCGAYVDVRWFVFSKWAAYIH
jgi:hypothetical protein